MSSKITGKEYPLLKIFSSDFEYYIPAYQMDDRADGGFVYRSV